jgi:2-polyprenyl-6-methoxyphenol hydroxylase-like FAD-dependent oxidoreductase
MTRVEVAIVGGGFAGLALACALAQRDRSVVVVERQTGTPPARRAVILQPNGLAALERIGALEVLLECGAKAERLRFCTPAGATLAISDYRELRCSHPYLLSVEPAAFQRTLAARLLELGGRAPVTGAEFTELLRDDGVVRGIRYCAADGTAVDVEADCVVGADGAASRVRDALGIEARHLAGPDPYVIGIGTRPDAARDGEIAIYCGPGYADGVVPLGERAYFWDHVLADDRAAIEARDLELWRERYARRVPVGRELASALEDFDQLLLLEVRVQRARRRIAPGATLIGDAAGTVHPHSAQGANLSLEEAITLADALTQRQAGAGPVTEHELARWSRARGRRLGAFQAWSLWVAHTWDAPHRVWRVNRRVGFELLRARPLRRGLLRWGAGLARSGA